MTRVLFVCLGNICRSPMAEGIFRQAATQIHQSFVVDSAATSNWEDGKPPHSGTQEILSLRNIPFSHMVSRPVNQLDFETFDWIIGMDQQNVKDLKDRCPKKYQGKIHLFLEVVTDKEEQDVPDPWYTGDFRQTERLIDQGVNQWLSRMKNAN